MLLSYDSQQEGNKLGDPVECLAFFLPSKQGGGSILVTKKLGVTLSDWLGRSIWNLWDVTPKKTSHKDLCRSWTPVNHT